METLSVDITLRLPHGQKRVAFEGPHRVALWGPTGSGKSSLVKTLVGVSDLGGGSFRFRDRDMMKLPPWERGIGYVPQDLVLMPHLDVRDNLLFPVNGKLEQEINEGLGVAPLLNRMPRHLSGGEKQRVALARALSCRPQLLILDEPFSSLDDRSRDEVVSFVDSFAQSREIPLIFISHDRRETEFLGCVHFHL